MEKIIPKIIVLIIISNISFCYGNQSGLIHIKQYGGLLGNRLFQFCLAKILSEELGFPLKCPPIYGFPETYAYQDTPIPHGIPTQILTGHKINFKEICANKSPRIITISGYFTRYEYIKKYKDKIKQWLRFDEPLEPHPNPNDIVFHIRIHPSPTYMYLPPSYYKKVLALTDFDQVYICTNEPYHPYIKKFAKYNPIIRSHTSLNYLMNEEKMSYEKIVQLALDDFKFIMSFNKIVTAPSTFSWWAGYLSEAKEIFAPITNLGLMSPQNHHDQLIGIEESRYTYIPCIVRNLFY